MSLTCLMFFVLIRSKTALQTMLLWSRLLRVIWEAGFWASPRLAQIELFSYYCLFIDLFLWTPSVTPGPRLDGQ